jgi:hypothetical protein
VRFLILQYHHHSPTTINNTNIFRADCTGRARYGATRTARSRNNTNRCIDIVIDNVELVERDCGTHVDVVEHHRDDGC